jgi:His-Xaa-Ser system radical SAM maturase HxsB
MSKFLPLSHFEAGKGREYKLLPFRFSELDGNRFVLTNLAGEFHILSKEKTRALVRHQLAHQSQEFADLKAKHFLIDDDSNSAIDLLALKVRTKLERTSNFTGLHLFVVTLRCEHSCPYCQVSRKSNDKIAFDMSAATADAAVELAFKSPSPQIKIEFQGGEPLLNFPMIQYIVERAKAKNVVEKRQLGFVIATNLAVITDDTLAYCREHSIEISTSLDGPADIHNRNRPRPGGDSYQRAIAGIRKARDVLGRDSVSAVMTTTEASFGRVRDIIDEYIALGFSNIFLRPLSPYGFAVKTKWYNTYGTKKWLDFYFEGLDYIIDLNRQGVQFRESYASMILTKMLTPFQPGYVDLISPAGIGTGVLLYNYDGAVFASDESRMLSEMHDDTFKLGHVSDPYEALISSDALLDPLEQSFAASVPMCSSCAFEPYCGADPVYHHATQGDFIGRKPSSGFCQRNMEIFKGLIARMEANADTRRLFMRWGNQ